MKSVYCCVEEEQENYQTSWLEDNKLLNTKGSKPRLERLLGELEELIASDKKYINRD